MNWKVTGIISLILNLLFILFFIWAINLGAEMEEQEMYCALNVCEDYNTYWYDEYDEICSCYNDEQEEVERKYIG